MMNFLRLTVAFALVISFANLQEAQADLFFTIEIDPPVAAGSTTSVSFFAESDVTGGETITGVNLPVDIGGEGGQNVLPAFLSNPGIANSAFASSSLSPSDIIFKRDGLANNFDGMGVNILESPTLLFDIVLDVSPTAPVGSIPVTIPEFSNPFFTVSTSGGAYTGGVAIDPAGGSVNIVAVPEPAAASVLALAALAGLTLRRRR